MPDELPGRSWRVMVVDDDPASLLLTQEVLKLFGVHPCGTDSPEAAYAELQRGTVDLIFMDVRMPGMNGLELTVRIRDLEQRLGRPRTPIVALTANAMHDEQRACLMNGMDGVLTKPVPIQSIKAALETWCAPRPASWTGDICVCNNAPL